MGIGTRDRTRVLCGAATTGMATTQTGPSAINCATRTTMATTTVTKARVPREVPRRCTTMIVKPPAPPSQGVFQFYFLLTNYYHITNTKPHQHTHILDTITTPSFNKGWAFYFYNGFRTTTATSISMGIVLFDLDAYPPPFYFEDNNALPSFIPF